MIRKQFPTAFDVEQAMTFHATSYEGLRRFMQSLGLINVGSGKKDIADFATGIFWGHQDYVQLRKLAQGAHAATSISGFLMRSETWPVKTNQSLVDDVIKLRDQLSKQEESLLKKGAPIPRLSMPKMEDGVISMLFEYQRVVPGRVELLERWDTEVNFTVEQSARRQWQVVCYPQANQDVKVVENLFKKLGEGTYDVFTISLENFSRRQRILFFDTLLEHYQRDEQWRFVQVTEITIRQPSSEKLLIVDEEDVESVTVADADEELEEVGRDDLRSITQAILQGKNLRTNSFVQECEKQGFYFLSMTFELANTKTPEVIQVSIRFKLSPQMFEVVLTNMAERTDIGERLTTFSAARQQEILKEFWNISHKIWRQLYETLPDPERQLSFASIDRTTP